jgi:hypothetical protein
MTLLEKGYNKEANLKRSDPDAADRVGVIQVDACFLEVSGRAWVKGIQRQRPLARVEITHVRLQGKGQ